MKTLVALVIALATALPAAAQQPGPFRRAQRPDAGPRQAIQRGEQPPARQAGAPAHTGPMTPDERRQLRRDIDEHGRDLYKDRRERR